MINFIYFQNFTHDFSFHNHFLFELCFRCKFVLSVNFQVQISIDFILPQLKFFIEMERKTRLIAIVLLLILQQVSGSFIQTNGPVLTLLTPLQTLSTPTGGQQTQNQQPFGRQPFGQLPFDKLQFSQLIFGEQRPQSPQTPSQQQQPPTQQCQGSCAARYEETIAALKQENQNLKETNQRIQNENSQLKSALQEQKKTIALYLNRIEVLERQNKEFRSTIQSLNQQIKQLISNQNKQALQSLVQNSKIVTSSQEGQQLKNFFPKRIKSARLCYRASENGFSTQKFHHKCDGIKDTLTVVQTTENIKVGGYTPLAWKAVFPGEQAADNSRESFVFSLTLNEKFRLMKNPQCAIYNFVAHGPYFGLGPDLFINSEANMNQYSRSILSSYGSDKILSNVPRQIMSAPGQQNRFITKEWEVWALEFA